MTKSMTGYAVRDGGAEGWRWTWEMRGVNGRGLDLRLRLPEWPPEMDPPVRSALQKALGRGNVTVSLRLAAEGDRTALSLNEGALEDAIRAARTAEERAAAEGLHLAPMTAAALLSMRGVLEAGAGEEDPAAVRTAILADLPALIEAFDAMRGEEGAALEAVLRGQVDAVAATVAAVRALIDARADHMAGAFREALARVTEQTGAVDEARVAQEIAALAVKADVTEELDRLDAHVDAARALLDAEGPKGRKLDFLIQEFNREANTLCSKAGFAALTALGLDLKHTVDQMREQVQNVE